MGYLYGGRVLCVDLSDRKIEVEPIESYVGRCLGGKGINAKVLFDRVGPETGPLDPANVLVFGAGPLVGTSFPGACRVDVMARSPVTGALGDAGMGGYLGAEMKWAGYDNIVITGRAGAPVYLSIRDDTVEIRDASHLWGRDTYETPALIRQELHDEATAVVSIGPAGEKLVVYACIMSPTGSAAARTGMGAVMGSKNLKAIAARGTKGVAIARPREFLDACQKLRASFTTNRWYKETHEWGLTRIHDHEMRHIFEVTGTIWPGCETISEESFAQAHLRGRVGCFACPVACFGAYDVAGVGSGCFKCSPPGDLTWDVRNPDLGVFWKAFVACQRYGLDARSLANALAWLMELYERGIITAADTDGIAMEWGSPTAIVALARKMSLREGIGDLLADGLPAAAQRLGRGAEDCLMAAKGSPSDLHLAPLKSRALAAAVSPIGEDAQVQPALDFVAARRYIDYPDEASYQAAIAQYKEMAGRAVGLPEAADPRTTTGKVALVRLDEERTDVCDITGVCTWMTGFIGLPVRYETIAEFMTLGLGREVTVADLKLAAARLQNVERAFAARMGLTRENDRLSKAYFGRIRRSDRQNRELGFSEAELERMKDEYYQVMGWDVASGLPTRPTLSRLGLDDVADRLGI